MNFALTGIELQHFRKFRDPIRLEGLGPGLNQLCEPNEAGKSTILSALHGVLFEKHRSNAQVVKDFQTAGDRTSPYVKLDFALDGRPYSIAKKFIGRDASARLTLPDGRLIDGDEAEEELQRLLGFTEPGARGSNADTIGMWGILWVRQGESFAQADFADGARGTLQNALEAEVGMIAGGARGQSMPAAIDAALSELVTKRGDPKGRFGTIVSEIAAIDAALPELERKRDQLAADIERLAHSTKDLAHLEQEEAKAEDGKRIEEARTKRDAILALQGRIRAAEAGVEITAQRFVAAEAALKARSAAKEAIRAAVTKRDKATNEASLADTDQRDAGDEALRLRQEADDAETAAVVARTAARDARRQQDAASLAEAIAGAEDRIAKAKTAHKRISEIAAEAGAIAVTETGIKQLRAAKTKLDAARATMDAVATEVVFAFDAEAAPRVRLDGHAPDAASGSRRAVADFRIDISGIGRIDVRPAIKDKATLLAGQADATRAFDDLLVKMRIKSLEEADALLDKKKRLEGDAEIARKEIALFVPGGDGQAPGVDAMRERVAADKADLKERLAELGIKTAPGRAEAGAALTAADKASEEVERKLAAARAAYAGPQALWDELRRKALEAATRATESADALAYLEGELVKAEEAQPHAELEDLLAKAEQEAKLARDALDTVRREDSGETLDAVDARIERLGKLSGQRLGDIQNLKIEIGRLRSVIYILEGDGIEEKIQRLKRDRERLDRERALFERETRTLGLLKSVLSDAEREARERLLAPIVRRLHPYLNALFPGSSLSVDEQFRVTGVVRSGGEEEFGRLSDGTREQIAILTRLAFAEMLAEQGKPATIILDDALVFSDDERMERMFDILNAAAKKTQIVILTCRRHLFAGLGGARLNILQSANSTSIPW